MKLFVVYNLNVDISALSSITPTNEGQACTQDHYFLLIFPFCFSSQAKSCSVHQRQKRRQTINTRHQNQIYPQVVCVPTIWHSFHTTIYPPVCLIAFWQCMSWYWWTTCCDNFILQSWNTKGFCPTLQMFWIMVSKREKSHNMRMKYMNNRRGGGDRYRCEMYTDIHREKLLFFLVMFSDYLTAAVICLSLTLKIINT